MIHGIDTDDGYAVAADLDIDLLRTFISVVDAGGFTRAGERVHRTQSTVSQQIQRLEEAVGKPLFLRQGRAVTLTEDGDVLLGYARRLLALHHEAKARLAQSALDGLVRLGIPEDVATHSLPGILASFSRAHPRVRLDVRCDLGVTLRRDLERGELDLILVKQETGDRGGVRVWREPLLWVTSADHPAHVQDPLPLAVFPQGCLYRNRIVHTLESQGRAWRVAYCSPSLTGIQAAVASGMGVSALAPRALPPGYRLLAAEDGFPPFPDTELALHVAASRPARPVEQLIGHIVTALEPDAARITGLRPPSRTA